jgi:hypothetical protein
MKWLLRLVAAWVGISVIVTGGVLAILAVIGSRIHADPILVVGMMGTVPLGGYAAAQLWRLKQTGRHATLGLLAFWVALWPVAAWAGRQISGRQLLRLGLLVPIAVVLVLPGARRTCR